MKHRYTLHSFRIILLTAAVLIALFACKKAFNSRNPSDPQSAEQKGLSLKITTGGRLDAQAKATQLFVTIEKNMRRKAGAPDDWQFYIDYTYPEAPSTALSFPFSVENVTLPYPPYEYRIKAAATLSRNTTVESGWQRLRIDDGAVYLGNDSTPSTTVKFVLETYERLLIHGVPLQVEQNGRALPENAEVAPNETLTVRCGNLGAGIIDAPDSDRFPVSITVWEEAQNGASIASAPFTTAENAVLEGRFPDPYGNNPFEREERGFACIISDTHGTSETFRTRVVRKLPEPIEVWLDCDANSTLIVERSATGGAVDVLINGENVKDLTIPLAAGAVRNEGTQGEPGGHYSLSGFEPEIDPQTGRPYIRASGSDTRCPVPSPPPVPPPGPPAIVIKPDCGGGLMDVRVYTADGTNLGQDTSVTLWEAGASCATQTISSGSSVSPVTTSCCTTSGNVVTINSISVGTDASGRPITGVGNLCTCPSP